jgi:hypothetical protein
VADRSHAEKKILSLSTVVEQDVWTDSPRDQKTGSFINRVEIQRLKERELGIIYSISVCSFTYTHVYRPKLSMLH